MTELLQNRIIKKRGKNFMHNNPSSKVVRTNERTKREGRELRHEKS
jgi:hypothetical protein